MFSPETTNQYITNQSHRKVNLPNSYLRDLLVVVLSALTAVILLTVSTTFADSSANKKPEKLAYQSNQESFTKIMPVISRHINEDQFHHALLAEFYNQAGEPQQTLNYYLPLALSSRNPALLKRVTEIATGSMQLKKGLSVAKHWVQISPEDIEARQYLTLLFLRNNQLNKSANELGSVYQLVTNMAAAGSSVKNAAGNKVKKSPLLSDGLKFVGALLVIESHHDKAYKVYRKFTKVHDFSHYKDQQNLVLASLASKAKKYAVVVSALENIDNLKGDKNNSDYYNSAANMKAKALKKLGNYEEAAKLLKSIVTDEKGDDSKRLELAQLLIMTGQKREATDLLNQLMGKHSKNYDLLKAIIALNIELQDWDVAKQNNIKLSKAAGYESAASFFSGEISEAQGNLNEALKNYRAVKSGVFLRNAHAKATRLSAETKGLKFTQKWLQAKQNKATKNKNKAYWIKLEADLLSDRNKMAESLALYTKAISIVPNKTSYRYYRGLQYERAKDIPLAESDFKFVLSKQKKNANALNALGYLLVEHTTRFDEAKKYIQQAYQLKPNDPTIIDSLGWVYFRTGKIQKAEKYLRKAYKANNSPQIASHLITVLAKSGQRKEARNILNQMIKKHPNSTALDNVSDSLGIGLGTK